MTKTSPNARAMASAKPESRLTKQTRIVESFNVCSPKLKIYLKCPMHASEASGDRLALHAKSALDGSTIPPCTG